MVVSAKKIAAEFDDKSKKVDTELVSKKVDNEFDVKEIGTRYSSKLRKSVFLTPSHLDY